LSVLFKDEGEDILNACVPEEQLKELVEEEVEDYHAVWERHMKEVKKKRQERPITETPNLDVILNRNQDKIVF